MAVREVARAFPSALEFENQGILRLTRWKTGDKPGQLFTCARPGRSGGTHLKTIPDEIVHRWVVGIPGDTGTCIISLLGRKPDPSWRSEFTFYSFRGGFDSATERPGCPTFQEWLDRWHSERKFSLFEYPTTDLQPLLPDVLTAVISRVTMMLNTGCIVVFVDSGGVGRTGRVCKALGFSTAASKKSL